jgi:hypothetical protein
MEVHHRSQSEQKPKTWKSLLLEGLLIFVAVTLSFFAENARAYFGDRYTEKAYIVSMVEDLKADVVNIDAIKKEKREKQTTGFFVFSTAAARL